MGSQGASPQPGGSGEGAIVGGDEICSFAEDCSTATVALRWDHSLMGRSQAVQPLPSELLAGPPIG